MLTVHDIPQKYLGEDAYDSPRFHRLAAGIQIRLQERYPEGDDREEVTRATSRLVQASFQLRSSRVGAELFDHAVELSSEFKDHPQFLYLSGNLLGVVAAASSIDLQAATLVMLAHGSMREPDLRQAANPKQEWLSSLPPRHQEWIIETGAMPEVIELGNLRNALVHRLVPLNIKVNIGGGKPTQYETVVNGQAIPTNPWKAFEVAQDRFISLCLLLDVELDAVPL